MARSLSDQLRGTSCKVELMLSRIAGEPGLNNSRTRATSARDERFSRKPCFAIGPQRESVWSNVVEEIHEITAVKLPTEQLAPQSKGHSAASKFALDAKPWRHV